MQYGCSTHNGLYQDVCPLMCIVSRTEHCKHLAELGLFVVKVGLFSHNLEEVVQKYFQLLGFVIYLYVVIFYYMKNI